MSNENKDKYTEITVLQENKENDIQSLPLAIIKSNPIIYHESFSNLNNTNSCETTKSDLKKIENKQRNELKDLIKHLRNETIKLFIKTFQTKSKILKFYLTFLLISVTAITSYILSGLILSYLAYEVLITSQIIAETPALFPRVTICKYINFQTEYAVEFLSQINRELNPNVNIFQLDYSHNLTYNEIDSLAKSIYDRAITIMNSKNFTKKQKRRLEHDVNDVLFDCKFNSSPCSIEKDFIWSYDKTFGNCYVFNSDLSGTIMKKSNIAGNRFGLNIKVYVNYHENLTLFHSFTSAQGVILKIENNTILFDRSLTDGYMRIEPGTVTSIKVDRTFMFELEKPYSTCDIPNGPYSEYFYK
jgi:hypothetical protein